MSQEFVSATLAFIIGSAILPAITVGKDAPRPNIIFIMADDLGWADVEFHGGNVPTSHLNQLLREGVELSQHYVAPVCSPTRTGLMTGRYWSRFGVTTPQNALALPFETVTGHGGQPEDAKRGQVSFIWRRWLLDFAHGTHKTKLSSR